MDGDAELESGTEHSEKVLEASYPLRGLAEFVRSAIKSSTFNLLV